MNYEQVLEFLNKNEIGNILENEPMSKHTTFKVGGNARFYIDVFNSEKLALLLMYIKQEKLDYYVIGKGSNVLFSDKDYDGIIISLNKYFANVEVSGNIITAGAGLSTIKLAQFAANNHLSGLEFISGVPATVGGAIYMNAGAYLSEVSDVLLDVTIINDEGELVIISRDELTFSYRHSIFHEHLEWIIVEARFELALSDKVVIKDLMEKRKEKRMATQPWDKPSAGSVFRNHETNAAWYYIDDCGLRGYQIGGAQISQKHSNFIINSQGASAQDIRDLIELVQKRVKEKHGIILKTEVRLINW